MLTESLAAGIDHRGDRVDDELGGGQIGRGFSESKCGHLEEHKKVIRENHLDGRLVQVGDFFVQVKVRGLIAHANQGSG